MRNWIVFALMLAMVSVSYGSPMFKGAKELAIEGLFDSDGLDGEYADFSLFYGEYAEDNLELGFQVRVIDTENTEQWRAGVRFEYNNTDFEVVPYVALTLEYAYYEIGTIEAETVAADGTVTTEEVEIEDADDDAFIVGGHAGLKIFLGGNVAVSAALVYEWATESIYATEGTELDDTDMTLRLGMRFFF